ncbi:transposase family protein [Streptomyces sp. NPDC102395]|uniref:helix-turn-helix domain-containing protein n=1 Tax=Streptomyces sp. NPDC102395 TaxID=3366168 RepID=UPI0038280B8E
MHLRHGATHEVLGCWFGVDRSTITRAVGRCRWGGPRLRWDWGGGQGCGPARRGGASGRLRRRAPGAHSQTGSSCGGPTRAGGSRSARRGSLLTVQQGPGADASRLERHLRRARRTQPLRATAISDTALPPQVVP